MRHTPGFTMPAAALILFALVGCGKHPQCDYYDFDFQKPLDYRQLVFRSSLIIVGTVKSVAITRSAVPARRAPELLLDETQVDVEVENVLRGEWPQPRLRFLFFAFSVQNRGGYSGPPPYRVGVGERRLFFLTTDFGEVRSVADVRGDYAVRVWSGLHKYFRRSEPAKDAITGALDSTAVGDDVSAILLELGDGYDSEGLAGTLGQVAYISDQLASRKTTVSRLHKLAAHGQSGPLQTAACIMLAEQYAGQSGCLYELENDTSLSTADRQRIAETLAKRKQWDVRLKEALRTRPMGAFDLVTVTAVRDEMELLVADPDPELHRLGCEALRRIFALQYRGCEAMK